MATDGSTKPMNSNAPVPHDMVARLAAFADRLRAEGLAVTPGTALDAAHAIERIDVADRAAFHAALRACCTTSIDDYPIFERIFRLYWDEGERALAAPARTLRPIDTVRPPAPRHILARRPISELSDEGEESRLPGGEGSASDREELVYKDFADLDTSEMHRIRRLVRMLAPDLATVRSRRTEPASGGDVDLRRTLRQARRHGGETLNLAHRRARRQKLRVVVLLDVSGSMDRYSGWLLQFLYALQGEAAGVHTFAFSTRLHDLTPLLRRKQLDEALDDISRTVPAWSGGTSIGACLREFVTDHGARLLTPRTVVIVASDGWERGEVDDLAGAMREIRRRARRVIWLNPLAGREGYQPLARGMAAALPYIDDFLPANTVAALDRLRSVLARAG